MDMQKKKYSDLSEDEIKMVERIKKLDCLMGLGVIIDSFFVSLFEDIKNGSSLVLSPSEPSTETDCEQLRTLQEVCLANNLTITSSRVFGHVKEKEYNIQDTPFLVLVREFTVPDIDDNLGFTPENETTENLSKQINDILEDLDIKVDGCGLFFYWEKDVMIDSAGLIYSKVKVENPYEHFEEYGEHKD